MLYSVISFQTVDILNKLHEAGLLKDNETAVMLVDNCLLTQYATPKGYGYKAYNIHDLKSSFLFSRQNPLTKDKYNQVAEKILESKVNYLPGSVKLLTKNERAKNLLSYIFSDVLPKHGMTFRNKQYELAIEMLQGMQNNKLMLCEAEVGTGKTHAYILAATVHNLFLENKMPTVISTSTIALQKALTEEYIPQISDILMEHKIIDKPLSFVVRKGKSHYVCDGRLRTYRSSIQNNNRNEERGLLHALFDMSKGDVIDLDGRPLTPYVKKRICAADCGDNCVHSDICRFMDFTSMCLAVPFDFQIANHNFVLADILNRKSGRKRLLPDAGIRIFDEAHKLLDAARQMYGVVFSEEMIPKLTRYAAPDKKSSRENSAEALRLCFELLRNNRWLFKELKPKRMEENNRAEVGFTANLIYCITALINNLNQLSELFYTSDTALTRQYKSIRRSCGQISEKLAVFLSHDEYICWLEKTDSGGFELCAIPKALNKQLYIDIWRTSPSCILTSGTLSVGGDFSHYKAHNGIDLANPGRILETSKPSPFDYKNNALLYIPNRMPFPVNRGEGYIRAVTKQIRLLIQKIHGHTLILFTSYRLMERVYYNIQQAPLPFPLFVMNRGRLDAISAFKKSGNGVLFASDSAGEGIDLAGDILSGLIVVKLPFPVPDPITEYERSLYGSMGDYLQEAIVPAMLIKLRQWFGRGIRRESDTVVFAILDSRAGLYGKYRSYVLNALPDIPVTARMDDVERFICYKKDSSYFLWE